MHKDHWLVDYEIAAAEFEGGEIDESEFFARLRALGFEPNEIAAHIAVLQT